MNTASRRSVLIPLACAFFAISARGNAETKKPLKLDATGRTAPLFGFHSNFWVNLHQALVHEALLQAGKPDRRLQSTAPMDAPAMSEQERKTWDAAVAFYAKTFGTRQELFDYPMIQINDALAQQPDDGSTPNITGLPPAVVATLKNAAPIYRRYWWPAQNASNQQWIASQAARVKQLGPQIAAAMQRDLHQKWPAGPVRVDVCYFVPAIGHAYTTITDVLPAHTTFSSSAPSLQDLSGFETLFHEASHSFADKMADALASECRNERKHCGDLWHAILFYTAGVEVRRGLPPADQAAFTPYAYRYGLYTRGDWPRYRAVLENDWQRYLDGKISFEAAIHSLVADYQDNASSQ